MKKQSILSVLVLLLCWSLRAEESAEPKHLTEARALVQKIKFEQNSYQHGKVDVEWGDECHCHADCSGLLIALLKRSYNYDATQLKKWFGSARPTAARFHDAIERSEGFTIIARVDDLRPGDVLAVKYKQPAQNTGHALIVSGPVKKIESKKPIQENTTQYEVPVIDSSQSGHGPTDTRHAKGENGKDHDGVGEGVFRIYADNDGKIAGYSWSLLGGSKFISNEENHLIAGRLVSDYKP